MSPAKKYKNLQVINKRKPVLNVDTYAENKSSALPTLQIVHNIAVDRSAIYSDWMKFTSNFGQGIFNKL